VAGPEDAADRGARTDRSLRQGDAGDDEGAAEGEPEGHGLIEHESAEKDR
jgi:hypothetical protein